MKLVQIDEPGRVAIVWTDGVTYEGSYTVSNGMMTVVSQHGSDRGPISDEASVEERAKMLMSEIAYVASGDRERARSRRPA